MLMVSPPSLPIRGDDSLPPHRGKVRYGPELRVLIVGGGVAGLTLAALLEQRGFTPLLVERATEYGDAGYVVGLWPAGSRILKGLKLFTKFCDVGVECSRYIIANQDGDTLHSFSFEPLTRRYGPLVDVGRLQLIDLLRSAVSERRLRFGVSVREIAETPDGVVAVFDDGTAELFDVVVGCDGIRSSVRRLAFGDTPLDYSGVTGWAFWLPPDFVPPPEVVEYWGAGKFVGMYPARTRFCAVAALQAPPNAPDPVETRVDRLRRAFADFGGIVPWVLSELPEPEQMLHVDFSDIRVDDWTRGRVVLLGDAAHALLPTAGMGASLAMESAAVLAEELCRTDSKFLIQCLAQYAARRRPRVDRIQSQSRRLGKVMFAGNGLVTRLRDRAVRIMADEPLLDAVEDMLAERI
jgi:2-polyprenyl-6-methoxyphenol hydroxylase-like FAD-dependent oxidoreductase